MAKHPITEHEAEERKARTRLYSFIGRITVHWQRSEDYLQDLLACLIQIDKPALDDAFNRMALPTKLQLITAAMSKFEAPERAQWEDVRKQLFKLYELRNQVAHADVREMGMVTIHLGSEERDGWAEQHPTKFEVIKRNTVYNTEQLKEHVDGSWQTWLDLLDFSISIKKKILA